MTPLREEMIREMQIHRLAENTQKAYVQAVKGLAQHYGRSPDLLGMKEIKGYLHYRQEERKLAWSTCNVTMCGLAFLYTEVLGREHFRLELPPRTRPRKLPEVLSKKEVARLLNALQNRKHRVLLETTYGGGLRVGEVVHLKLTDIESDRGTIRVDQGKGDKDHRTILSGHLLDELREYWKVRKPPEWLFPGNNLHRPMSRSAAQQIYYKAKKAAGIRRGHGIHTLRHSFATHALEDGVDSTVVQSMLGHAYVSTTARYLHISQLHLAKIKSPLDTLPSGPYMGRN